jgi:flagella basal body P-ring formation protein FlgA
VANFTPPKRPWIAAAFAIALIVVAAHINRLKNGAVQKRPARDIKELEPWADNKVHELHNQHVTAADYLWAQIGQDFDHGISQLHEREGFDTADLLKYFSEQGKHEVDLTDGPGLRRMRTWIRQNWLEEIIFAGLLVFAMLLIRSQGSLAMLPAPFGLQDTVVIAAHDMAPNDALQAGDFYSARLALPAAYFTDPQQLDGLIAAQTVTRGKPVRYADVLRLQVVAARDIPPNTIVMTDAVTLAWSPYAPDAATRLDQVANHQTFRALPKGKVIVTSSVSRTPVYLPIMGK